MSSRFCIVFVIAQNEKISCKGRSRGWNGWLVTPHFELTHIKKNIRSKLPAHIFWWSDNSPPPFLNRTTPLKNLGSTPELTQKWKQEFMFTNFAAWMPSHVVPSLIKILSLLIPSSSYIWINFLALASEASTSNDNLSIKPITVVLLHQIQCHILQCTNL